MSTLDSWFAEKQSAWLYLHLAKKEQDRAKHHLFLDLAASAESQAQTWAGKIVNEGGVCPAFKPTWRSRLIAGLIKTFGIRTIRPILAASKVRGLSVYLDDGMVHNHSIPTSIEQIGLRHRGYGGGKLRAAVFGVSDGLVSNTALIMGVVGGMYETNIILLAGIAGLLAGAFSMGVGEYISMRSQREMYEYQIALEREELETYPEEEAEEIALIYHARGMELSDARRLSKEIIEHPNHAMDVLAREELGLNPNDLGSPWGAAIFSFVSFFCGALIPLFPFLIFADVLSGLLMAVVLVAGSLFVVGATIGLFTGKNVMISGLRMFLIGAVAGLVTYGIGCMLA